MHFASWLTIFGQAEVALPACSIAILYRLWQADYRVLSDWALPLLAAFAFAVMSKIAFMGWGVGSAAYDFTGISGHALSAAAIYPVLFGMLLGDASPRVLKLAVLCGYLFALAIAASRVAIGAHSPSEVVAGFMLGAAVSGAALLRRLRPLPTWPCAIAFGWIGLMPIHPPGSHSHELITRLALDLSHRSMPYTRADLHRLQ